jgi:basic amino acid/polyamine antiporter, APA family
MAPPPVGPSPDAALDTEFKRGLGLFDSTMIVVGSMIGSGVFLVSAEMSRQLGSVGWLLASWIVSGLLTVMAALSYGELAAMMPKAGGQYVYLREAFSPLVGFLFGWTFFMVIQTGTIAAVSVGFARHLGALVPWLSDTQYLIAPIHLSSGYAVSLSTVQLVAILLIVSLTWVNTRGLDYGRLIQNTFTSAKSLAVLGLIVVGLALGWNREVVAANFQAAWQPHGAGAIAPGLELTSAFGLFVALCVAQVGSLFACDSWNNITFTAGEVREPRRNIPLSLALGAGGVVVLYLLANVAYVVTLPLAAIQQAPADRVAATTVEAIFPGRGAMLLALAIMVSTFGCCNGLVLSGARAYYAMARDRLFFPVAGHLNEARVPAWGLVLQGVWAVALVLPRTYDPATGRYGNLYSNLLDYIVSAALVFYVLTILGLFRLRATRPDAPRPYRAIGYPWMPALYIAAALTILVVLCLYRPATTWPGLVIALLGLPAYALFRLTVSEK